MRTCQSCFQLQCSYIRTGASRHQWPTVEQPDHRRADVYVKKEEKKEEMSGQDKRIVKEIKENGKE